MNVEPAWRKGITGQNTVVSILDDGIEKDHPDLKKNYVSYSTVCLRVTKVEQWLLISCKKGLQKYKLSN